MSLAYQVIGGSASDFMAIMDSTYSFYHSITSTMYAGSGNVTVWSRLYLPSRKMPTRLVRSNKATASIFEFLCIRDWLGERLYSNIDFAIEPISKSTHLRSIS